MELLKNKEQIITTYINGNDKEKQLLENIFGKEIFMTNETDPVKIFENFLKSKGLSIQDYPLPYKKPTSTEEEAINAFYMLRSIAKILKKDWTPDWNDKKEKWFPVFNMSGGVGFSYSHSNFGPSFSTVGSRLCFPTEEMSDFFGKEFLIIHRIVLINN